MKIITGFLLVAVFGLLAILFISYTTQSKYTISDSPAVIKQIRSLQRLETATFTVEKIIDAGTSGNQFSEFLFGDRILLIAHGDIIAGFDLADLPENTVDISNKTITLTLPPPRILVTKLDNTQTKVYDRRTGLLSKGDKDLESTARLAAEQSIQKAACDEGILTQAAENAHKQVTAVLKAMQFETITINIPLGSC